AGYLFRLRYGPDRWSHQDMFSETLPDNPDDVKDVRPLYTTPPEPVVTEAMVDAAACAFDIGTGDPNDYKRSFRAALAPARAVKKRAISANIAATASASTIMKRATPSAVGAPRSGLSPPASAASGQSPIPANHARNQSCPAASPHALRQTDDTPSLPR